MRLISFRPPIVSACVTPEPENVFHSQTCALLTIVVLIARCLYITGKGGERKEWKDKGKCFGSAFLGVNGASPNLFHDKPSAFVHFFFRGRWFSDRNTQQLPPSQETGPLALCVERFLSSCSGLFLFASAIAFCSTYSDALPSPNLLTSFPSQFDVYFPVPPVTNC